jgi:hypothetical protein
MSTVGMQPLQQANAIPVNIIIVYQTCQMVTKNGDLQLRLWQFANS